MLPITNLFRIIISSTANWNRLSEIIDSKWFLGNRNHFIRFGKHFQQKDLLFLKKTFCERTRTSSWTYYLRLTIIAFEIELNQYNSVDNSLLMAAFMSEINFEIQAALLMFVYCVSSACAGKQTCNTNRKQINISKGAQRKMSKRKSKANDEKQ